jgi:FkbM family methyltransferase
MLRALPAGLRMKVWSRLYEGKVRGAENLYEGAALEFAPRMRMDLIPGDVISDSIAFTGIYELGLTRTVVERARRGGLLVDVGANLGYFSLLWAGAGNANRCVAIEPSQRNVDFLKRNVNRNGCGERVTVVSGAAGEANGKAYFDPGPEEQSGWGGLTARSEGVLEVRCDALTKWWVKARRWTCSRLMRRERTAWSYWAVKSCCEKGEFARFGMNRTGSECGR